MQGSTQQCVRIAVLANMAFRRPSVQQQIRQLGGVELLLSQCQASKYLGFHGAKEVSCFEI